MIPHASPIASLADSGPQGGLRPCGVAAVDAALGGGFDPHGPHEITPHSALDRGAAAGFLWGLLARLTATDGRAILWIADRRQIQETGDMHAHGLAPFGDLAARLILVRAPKPLGALQAAEDALRSGAAAAVIVGAAADFTATRRLALAAARGGTLSIVAPSSPVSEANAARTRWRIAARPSPPDPYDPAAPGAPAFHADLARARGGRPGSWEMVWRHETHAFDLAAPLSARPACAAA